MAGAARLLFRQIKQEWPRYTCDAASEHHAQTEGEPSRQDLQRRPFEAGVIREIKPPITDLTPCQNRNRQAVPIQGESLSETILRERR
jgi:hypothetical protein